MFDVIFFYQNFVHLAYIFFTRSYSNQRIEVLRSVQVALQLSFTKAYSIESHSYYKTTILGWLSGWLSSDYKANLS